jgi:hypothetical protein
LQSRFSHSDFGEKEYPLLIYFTLRHTSICDLIRERGPLARLLMEDRAFLPILFLS